MTSNSQAQFFTVSSVALKAGFNIHNEHIGKAFNSLVSIPEDANIFTGDKGKIPVNRALLSIFSPILRKLFSDIPCCVFPTIFLPDCTYSSIKHLLSLISTGVTNNDKIVAKDVLSAAKLLSIDLKNIVRGTLNNSKSNSKKTKVNNSAPNILAETTQALILDEQTVETFTKQPFAQNNNKRKPLIADPEKNQNKKLRLKFNFPTKKDIPKQEEILPSVQQNQQQMGSSPLYSSQQQLLSSQKLEQPQQYSSQQQLVSSQQLGQPQQYSTQQQFGPSQQYFSQQHLGPPPQYPSQQLLGPSQQHSGIPPQHLGTPQHYPSQQQLGPLPPYPSQQPPQQVHQGLRRDYPTSPQLYPNPTSQNSSNSLQFQSSFPQFQPPLSKQTNPSHSSSMVSPMHSTIESPQSIPPTISNRQSSSNDLSSFSPKETVQSTQFAEHSDVDSIPSKIADKSKPSESKEKGGAVSTKNAEPELIELDADSETITSESEPIGIQQPLIDITKECQICHEKESKLSLLWRHYYVKHFYKELKTKFEEKIVDNSCPSCSAKFPAIQAVLLHLGRKHSEINQLLKEQNLKPIPKEESTVNPQTIDSVPESAPVPKSTPASVQESSIKKEPINCQICSEKNFVSISALWSHYCLGHYYPDIKSKFGHLLKDKMCVICDKTFDRPMKSILHLGTTHRKLNNILKENGLIELLTPKEHALKNKESTTIAPQSIPSMLESKDKDVPQSILSMPESKDKDVPQAIPSSSESKDKDVDLDLIKSEPISCLMCKQNYFRNYDDLWRHYCTSHFYQELKAQFSLHLKGKTCISCNQKFSSRQEAAQHIGIKHQKVNSILKSKGLDELPLPTIHKYPSTPNSFYLVDLEENNISLETREPKQNSVVDLETNKTINEPKTVTKETNEAFTEEQTELLVEEFNEDELLPAERKNALALALELTEDEVENWFKKRRENKTNGELSKQQIGNFTDEQEGILKEEFSEDQNLSSERRNTLALALDLTEVQVENWFLKNRSENLTNSSKTKPKPVEPLVEIEEPVEPIPSAKEEFLKLEFESNPDLPEERKIGLALALGLKENQVKKWFNCKRQIK